MLTPNTSHTLALLTAATLPQLDLSSTAADSPEVTLPSVPRTQNVTSPRDARDAHLVVIQSDFIKDTTLRRGCAYVVIGEVHVRGGVTLTIEDNTTILIRNGLRSRRTIDTSALIFDSGSGLQAGTVTFGSADESGGRVHVPNNGGVFFCGSFRNGTKDGVSSVRQFRRSHFRAERIILDHVGRPDPREGDGNDNDRDDIDAISIIGVGEKEWGVRAIESHGSGDDGFDAYNSSISLDTLIVTNPTEDGVNLTSSRLTVRNHCVIDMSESKVPDRELFDFEIDNGRCRLTLAKNAVVKLSGLWGTEADDVRLKSADMPCPPGPGAFSLRYEFDKQLSTRAVIYSAAQD